jgi:hypothetical protein
MASDSLRRPSGPCFRRDPQVDGGVLLGIRQAERPESFFEPRFEALVAACDQFAKTLVHKPLKVIGVTSGGTAERVPDIGELAIFQALESDVTHAVALCKMCAARRLSPSVALSVPYMHR